MKRCLDCERIFPLEDFVRNRSAKDRHGAYCRPCQNLRYRASVQKNHGSTRHYHLKRRYGIGAAEVTEMMRAQGWLCPICLRALDARSHVDHDHETGKVRAVLCFNCNGGLGQFKDTAASLRRAAAYLEGDVWQPIRVAPGVFQLPFSLPAAPRSASSSAATTPSSSRVDVARLRPR